MSAISRVAIPSARAAQIRQRLWWLGVLGVIFGAASYKLGVLGGLAAIALALVVPLLLNHPQLTFGLWMTAFIVGEDQADWHVGVFEKLYAKTPVYASVSLMLLLLATVAAFLDVVRPQVEFRMPKPFGIPLALLVLAIVFGFVSGAFGPGIPKFEVLGALEVYAALLLPPFVIVNVIRTRRDLNRLLLLLAGLAAAKALLGVLAVLTGITTAEVGTSRLSYIAPMSNWLSMTYLLVIVGAALTRARLPRWMWAASPLVLASFALGERRSFWLAAVFALLLMVLLGSGRTGRRLLLPAAGLTAIVLYFAIATGVVGPVQGQLVTRATSITPTKVSTNTEDRYRLAELRNVVPAIEKQPVSGLGVGVPWPEISPLPFEFQFNHTFAHVAVLYWWMTCGLIGALAYVVLMVSAALAGVRMFSTGRDQVLRVVALAIALGWVGLAVVEVTTTVIGADRRGTALMAVSLGILAVIYRLSHEDRAGPTPQGIR